jgi:hypothetical protein
VDIGCLVITTNLPHRLQRTVALLESIENADRYLLDNKVLSIDLQPDIEGCEDQLRSMFEPKGWLVVQAPCTGERAMLNNIQRGLMHITEDTLLYCEDHIIIDRLPSKNSLWQFMDLEEIGWINFNTHIHQENLLGIEGFVEPPGKEGKLGYVNSLGSSDGMPRWYHTDEGEEFLIKETCIRDEYFLNFPAAIAPRKVFTELMAYGMQYYSGVGIEIGFTKAWFDLGFDKIYQVAIYTKPGTIDKLPFDTFSQLHENACIRFRNNDSTMLHDSIVAHQTMPAEKDLRRSFF